MNKSQVSKNQANMNHMNKIHKIIILVICLLIPTGCNGVPAPSKNAVIADYFPAKTNAYYDYVCRGHDISSQQIYNTYITGNRIQRRITTDSVNPTDSLTTEVLELLNGELKLIYGDMGYYYFEDITSVKPIYEVIILKEPLTVGTTWELDANYQCVISAMDTKVSTPSGEYEAMEILITPKSVDKKSEQRDYYVKGIGLVKSLYNIEGREVSVDLASLTEGAGLTTEYNYSYPSGSNLLSETRTITLNTNADLAAVFEDEFKKPAGGSSIFGTDTKINSITVDRSEDAMVVDISNNFGDGTDEDGVKMALEAMTATLSEFYEVETVQFSFDGEFRK